MGGPVTTVYNWRGFRDAVGTPVDEFQLTGNFPVTAGSTLVRSILTVEVQEVANFPHFPPVPALPVVASYYQATNTTALGGLPNQRAQDTDFVCSGVPQFFADFGVTSAVQSDLTWQASITFDVKSQRKALVSNPSFAISIGWVVSATGGNNRVRLITGSAVLRTLWEHHI